MQASTPVSFSKVFLLHSPPPLALNHPSDLLPNCGLRGASGRPSLSQWGPQFLKIGQESGTDQAQWLQIETICWACALGSTAPSLPGQRNTELRIPVEGGYFPGWGLPTPDSSPRSTCRGEVAAPCPVPSPPIPLSPALPQGGLQGGLVIR